MLTMFRFAPMLKKYYTHQQQNSWMQDVKLRLDFVDIWSFYHHSDFTWNQILANWNGPKMSFIAISETMNFDFSKFEQLSSPKFTKI